MKLQSQISNIEMLNQKTQHIWTDDLKGVLYLSRSIE